MTAFDGCACPELTDEDRIPEHLYGLFVLLQTSDSRAIDALSLRDEKALQLLGMVIRHWQFADEESGGYLEKELSRAMSSEGQLQRAGVLVAIMRWISAKEEGFGSPAFAGLLARVATGQLPQDGLYAREEGALYGLRWNAAEAILLAGDRATEAVPTIVEYLTSFRDAVASAEDDRHLETVSTEYQSGKIVRVLVSVLRNVPTVETERILQGILDMG